MEKNYWYLREFLKKTRYKINCASIKCDVQVVCGGPAGYSEAWAASMSGANTILLVKGNEKIIFNYRW